MAQVGQRWTEVHGVSACSGAAKLQVVIIPGNPGSGLYYKTFLEKLGAELRGQADIILPSHLAHDIGSAHGDLLVDLDGQIQHKVGFLKEHVLLPGRPPVIIMGHSIGCLMTLHAIPMLEPQLPEGVPSILKVVCMFPFFESDFTVKRVRQLNKMCKYYRPLGACAGLMRALPKCMKNGIFKMCAKDPLEPHALQATRKLLTTATVRQYLYLASCYVVEKPFPWSLLTDLGPRVVVFGCPDDTWLPKNTFDIITREFKSIQAIWEPNMAHAFIVSVERCKHGAKLLTTQAMEVLQQHQQHL